jgi:hypothetical protein
METPSGIKTGQIGHRKWDKTYSPSRNSHYVRNALGIRSPGG